MVTEFTDYKRANVSPMDVWVSQRVRIQRTVRGMSQIQLGRLIGVGRNQMCRMESAAAAISITQIHRIANALQVHPGHFFDGAPKDMPDLAVIDGAYQDPIAVKMSADPELALIVRRVSDMTLAQRQLMLDLSAEFVRGSNPAET
jgi:transcriptional regulator with XRE-family HTH domain